MSNLGRFTPSTGYPSSAPGRTEFIWVRNFDSLEDLENKTRTYVTSPERKALGAMPGALIAKTEVRVIEAVLTG